eukprot:TRINITY_DN4525_c0_g3_i1.p1 TRINITY_DN4525_c0_g3~~TRINITY_DN4525_c0_g3_i1.p1  ORF type:complete len:410 (-),score=114.53 TRINITY_DN4525_c0_g3_i1:54-1283(-)
MSSWEKKFIIDERNENIKLVEPIGRSNHSLVINDDIGYIFGGTCEHNGKQFLSNALIMVDLNSYVITQILPENDEEWPCARDCHSAIVSNDRMVIFGGNAGEMEGRLNDCFIFSFETNKWTKVDYSNDILPESRCNHSAVVWDQHNKMIIYGGWNWNDSYSDVYSLDLETFEWKLLSNNIDCNERVRHSSAFVPFNDKIGMMIVVAGEDKDMYLQNDCYFTLIVKEEENNNLKMINWDQLNFQNSNLRLSERYAHDIIFETNSQSIVVVGGYAGDTQLLNDFMVMPLFDLFDLNLDIDDNNNENQYGNIINDVKNLNLKWKCCNFNGNLPDPRFGHKISLSNNQLYLFGGTNNWMVKLDDFFSVDNVDLLVASSEDNIVANDVWTCAVCTFENVNNPLPFCSICTAEKN